MQGTGKRREIHQTVSAERVAYPCAIRTEPVARRNPPNIYDRADILCEYTQTAEDFLYYRVCIAAQLGDMLLHLALAP